MEIEEDIKRLIEREIISNLHIIDYRDQDFNRRIELVYKGAILGIINID